MPTGKTNHRGRFTNTQQRKAVNAVFSLIKNGDSITRARKLVANEMNVNPNTIWVWQDKFGMKPPHVIKTTNLISNSKTSQSAKMLTKSGTDTIKGLETVKGKLAVVFTSLVNKDGMFSNQDASAISSVANTILGTCKQVLEERKAMRRTTEV